MQQNCRYARIEYNLRKDKIEVNIGVQGVQTR